MKRELLQQCQKYDPKKHLVNNWFVSEKLDGIRGLWDGGVTRGLKVPWTDRVATGLWTRYGNVVSAPCWWLDAMPKGIALDGEFWCGYKTRQDTASIIKRYSPDDRWTRVCFVVFDLPNLELVFKDGRVHNLNMDITFKGFYKWLGEQDERTYTHAQFKDRLGILRNSVTDTTTVRLLAQEQLPNTLYIKGILDGKLKTVVDNGGEGLVIRDPNAYYACERSHQVLKYKPYDDDECVVCGWEPGVGKYEGMMGSLRVCWNSKFFQLSGFTDAERSLATGKCLFENGRILTFKYRGLTADGIPNEASFLREF